MNTLFEKVTFAIFMAVVTTAVGFFLWMIYEYMQLLSILIETMKQ